MALFLLFLLVNKSVAIPVCYHEKEIIVKHIGIFSESGSIFTAWGLWYNSKKPASGTHGKT